MHSIFTFIKPPKTKMAKNKSAVELKEMKNGEMVEEDSDDGPVHVVPPDGGWGWVIIIATSINLVS